MEGVEMELERRSKFLDSLIQQKKKAKEQQDLKEEFNVRVRASDMPLPVQNRAFSLSREILNATPGKADNKRLALALKKSLAPVVIGSPVNEQASLTPLAKDTAMRSSQRVRAAAINSLRQISCKIILIGVEFNLKPVTHAEIFQHMMSWLVSWDMREMGAEKSLSEWLRSCLEVIWLLVDEGQSRIPFYELLRSGLQFIENIPDGDEALFTLVMEIHRRRDTMAMHMLMLDQHLHCPTFGTHRISSQTPANVSAEAVAHLRYSPITYPSVLGEPLCGEDLAMSIPQGSLDWERAVRCIRHAIRTTPSPDWWKRVLVVAPGYRPSAQAGPIPGAVFTSDMIYANCWQEWLVFSDIFFFLIKSGCTDFVDFIDKLVLRLNGADNHILRTNHVTWLLAQIIRVELVMTALNSDLKKVETTRKILSFHREDRTDPNNPQSVLLDFVSSCQNLRIWSLSATTRAYLNNDQLLKGKQIDEWWRSKGERMMDYMNLDDRSIGMFWVVSYTMAQPACETVINWLSSSGMAELPGLQPNERVMMMQEVTPLPMSLLSGFSMNLCLKLALQLEEALFVSQARVLREVSPEEVTANIYTLVDVLLHKVHVDLQRGHNIKEILDKHDANLAFFFWTHEMLPLDIFILALIDRDDDPHALIIAKIILERPELMQRINMYCANRGPPEHWLFTQVFKRNELQKALGNHLSWKDRYPTFFDDIAARLLPVIPLVVYRLIENNAMDTADKILTAYSHFLAYHPLRFTFVRDILAYFYGHLPGQLVVKILRVLGLSKIPFSESFPQYISNPSSPTCPPLDYFATLLLNLVNNVIPPLSSSSSSNCSSRSGSMADMLNSSSARSLHGKTPGASQPGPANASEGQKAFYQIQDPGTYTQLVLETAVIEILSLPVSAAQIVSSLVQIIVNIQSTLIQSGNGFHGAANGVGQGSVLPTSPSGGSTDSMSASRSTCMNTASFVSRSGYTCQQLSCLLIQACGLLLAQLPPDFHTQLYMEASRVIRETWWLTDGKRSQGELDSAVGYALMDPTWAAQDNTSTAIGNIVALLHAFFSNLPQEWLDGTHLIIKNLRPVTSVAMLRVVFRIMGPLLPRIANTHALFNKTLALLLSTMVDVFGKNSQTQVPVEASQIADLIDFLHHVVHYEGQGGAVQSSSKPRPDILALIGRAADSLRPDVQHLLSHLRTDPNSSIYAAAHQNTAKTNTS
ncbi:hypothetical protein DY000_02023567 [Brassica cretica]|uniref:Uncharacterized protein n=1 Tax=Brassica cretica TaxID=69181 RepID=A0ABQ7E4U9_BRACR|nr:hypothetical protein DY000_02023567 [Brassica cretica]